jgi:hypothetical protein
MQLTHDEITRLSPDERASRFCALTSRDAQSLAAIAREANISYRMLQNWLERLSDF